MIISLSALKIKNIRDEKILIQDVEEINGEVKIEEVIEEVLEIMVAREVVINEAMELRIMSRRYVNNQNINYHGSNGKKWFEGNICFCVKTILVRSVIAVINKYDLDVYQLDMKTAFLNGFMDEEMSMEISDVTDYPGNVTRDNECKIESYIWI